MHESIASIYHEIFQAFLKNRAGHAIFLSSPFSSHILELSKKLTFAFLCKGEDPPCGTCQSCHLLSENLHPDLTTIQREKSAKSIKIEQIRLLKDILYISPQLGKNRVIVIEEADSLTHQAANALLKSLEEPREDVYFILLAKQKHAVLPTIRSRCQIWEILPRLELHESYFEEASGKSEIFSHVQEWLSDLIAFKKNETNRILLAEKWSYFNIDDILWFLYLTTSQMTQIAFGLSPVRSNDQRIEICRELSKNFLVFQLFQQQERLHAIFHELEHTMGINSTLLIQELLTLY